MTPQERIELLDSSIPCDPEVPGSRRYAMRRTDAGLQLFEAKFTQEVDGVLEFHGHPTNRVPAKVLRQFRDRNLISSAEYRRLVKSLG